jgi:hypothetical protein
MPRTMAKSDLLTMWVVYDHPKDFPDEFIARLWMVGSGQTICCGKTLTSKSLDQLRGELRARGFTVIPRMDGDDPKIVEVWL